MMTKQELPAFDSVAKALVFAFNASDAIYIASPVMNRAMAETKIKKKVKKGAQTPPEAEAKPKGMTPTQQPAERLQGLDKAHQAGIILHQVKRLDLVHANILKAAYTQPTNPCQCQMPCCQGFRVTPGWAAAVSVICTCLKESGDVLRRPGKKGFSTDPTLRRLLVERYFTDSGLSTAKIARMAKVSNATAAKHEEWILDYLDQEQTEAKLQIANIFDAEGITGFLP